MAGKVVLGRIEAGSGEANTIKVDSDLKINGNLETTGDETIGNNLTIGSNLIEEGGLPAFLPRAWVNFDGGTVDASNHCSIYSSGNVSYVERIGTGRYNVYFATPMPDANYSVFISGRKRDEYDDGNFAATYGNTVRIPTSTYCPITTIYASSLSLQNFPSISIMIMR